MAYASWRGDSVRILFGDTRGRLGTEHQYTIPAANGRLIASDLNGDGLQDLATVADGLHVLPGASGGGFNRAGRRSRA